VLGGLETVIGLLIVFVAVAILGPKAYWKWRKMQVYGKVLDELARRKAAELRRAVEKGEVSEEEVIRRIEEEVEA